MTVWWNVLLRDGLLLDGNLLRRKDLLLGQLLTRNLLLVGGAGV